MIITIGYVLMNILITYYNDTILNSRQSLGPSDNYYFFYTMRSNLVVGLLGGLLGGSALIYINNSLFRKKSFRYALLFTGFSYTVIFIVVSIIIGVISVIPAMEGNMSFTDFVPSVYKMMQSFTLITSYLLWGVITMFTLFLLQVNDKFGPGILIKFLKGKYYTPKEEERVFMFLDMRSSTTIAEQIGNSKYFNLLSDLFRDITDTILNNEGEIYQYVGDEVVVSWSLHKGVKNAQCINCFLEIQARLLKLGTKYESKYGVAPVMKAGIHCGKVIAGEVGSIKKDIVYSGDVLNTTARIQEQCNKYKVNILISSEVVRQIKNDLHSEIEELGKIELRGKKRDVTINTLRLNQ